MSMSRRVGVAIVVALMVVGLSACAKPPQEAIDQAQAALTAAAQSEAAAYAPEAWEAAQQAAVTAKDTAVANKEQMRLAVEGAIASIEEKLVAADGMLESLATCRRRPKGFAADLEIMRGNVDGLRAQLADVQAKAAEGVYIEAKSMAEGLLSGLDAAVMDMESVKAKLGC